VSAVERRRRGRRPAARPLLHRGRARRDRHERRRPPATAGSSRCRGTARGERSTAPSSTRCSTSRSPAAGASRDPAAGARRPGLAR
jgi:hypothetical protein